jgi:hypothetical protein
MNFHVKGLIIIANSDVNMMVNSAYDVTCFIKKAINGNGRTPAEPCKEMIPNGFIDNPELGVFIDPFLQMTGFIKKNGVVDWGNGGRTRDGRRIANGGFPIAIPTRGDQIGFLASFEGRGQLADRGTLLLRRRRWHFWQRMIGGAKRSIGL